MKPFTVQTPAWVAQAIRTPENYAADLAWVERYRARKAYEATHTLDDQFAAVDAAAARARRV